VNRFHRRARDERGAVAVEFALISTMLFMLLFGIIEFGQVYSQYEVFVNAAREGARVGAVRQNQAAMQSAVTNASTGYTLNDGNPVTITVNGAAAADPPCSDSTVGQPVAVSWTQPFTINIPFLPSWHPQVGIKGVFECE
jgi:Flp pilus assembly protein TadG